MFTHKLLGPVAGLFLGLAAGQTFAGEWVPVDTGQAGLSAITYRSAKMLPGEQATLAYTGTEIVSRAALGNGKFYPNKVNTIILQIVLTSDDKPITGFTGVTLRRDREGEELDTLYSADERTIRSSGPNCGGYTLQSLPDGRDEQCLTRCYRSYDDVIAQKNVIACDGGNAYWIATYAAGTLVEQLVIGDEDKAFAEGYAKAFPDDPSNSPRMSRDEIVAAANYLVVRLTRQGSTNTNFPIDDTFRAALWDDIPFQQ